MLAGIDSSTPLAIDLFKKVIRNLRIVFAIVVRSCLSEKPSDDDNARRKYRSRTRQTVFGGPLSGLTDAGVGYRRRFDGVMIWTIRCWGRKRLASAMVGGGRTNVVCRVEAGFRWF